MSFVWFWLLLFLIFLVIYFGLPFLIYFFVKKTGNFKMGIISGLTIFAILTCLIFYFFFEDNFFYKRTARKELKTVDLVLMDDFEILGNESGGFTDYYHIFELKISDRDVNKLIRDSIVSDKSQIKVRYKELDSNNFKEVIIDTTTQELKYQYFIN